jgi:hypothetical protein
MAELREFLASLAVDPKKLGAFIHDPDTTMAAEGLSEEDQHALRSGFPALIHARLTGVPIDEAFDVELTPPVAPQQFVFPVQLQSPSLPPPQFLNQLQVQLPPQFQLPPQQLPPQFVHQLPPQFQLPPQQLPPQFVHQLPPQFQLPPQQLPPQFQVPPQFQIPQQFQLPPMWQAQ